MKKLFLLLTIFSLLFTSCSKSFEASSEDGCKESSLHEYSITANAPAYDATSTKAGMDAIACVTWELNDKISVIDVTAGKYLGDLTATAVSVNGFVATFTGTTNEIKQSNLVAYVYPAITGINAGETFSSYEQSIESQTYSGTSTTFCAYATKAAGTSHSATINFQLATSYVNLNLASLPFSGNVNLVELNNINNGLTWKINNGAFEVAAPGTKNGRITVTVTNVTVSSSNNAVVRFAVPASDEVDTRYLVVNNCYSSISYPKTARQVGKFYNQIISDLGIYFTVNSSGKRVHFTKGNLYWDASPKTWKFESNQYDYRNFPTTNPDDYDAVINGVRTKTTASTVGSLFWTTLVDYQSNDADYMPYAKSYKISGDPSLSDKFFCGEDNKLTVDGVSGCYALSSDEWNYLITGRNNAANLYKFGSVKIGTSDNDKVYCLVIAPDYFSGVIKSSYDNKSEWGTAELQGLVCLPNAGYTSDVERSVGSKSEEGYYWSSTAEDDEEYLDYAKFLNFTISSVGQSFQLRNVGSSVRLVYE